MADSKTNIYRVLIVDDDPHIRMLLAELLKAPNRSVEVRDTPRAAVEFVRHNPVDLALLDMMMPGMNGVELATKIKEKCPQAHIVICTGYLVEAGCPEVRDRAEHVLHKPLNLGEVLQLADAYSAQ